MDAPPPPPPPPPPIPPSKSIDVSVSLGLVKIESCMRCSFAPKKPDDPALIRVKNSNPKTMGAISHYNLCSSCFEYAQAKGQLTRTSEL